MTTVMVMARSTSKVNAPDTAVQIAFVITLVRVAMTPITEKRGNKTTVGNGIDRRRASFAFEEFNCKEEEKKEGYKK